MTIMMFVFSLFACFVISSSFRTKYLNVVKPNLRSCKLRVQSEIAQTLDYSSLCISSWEIKRCVVPGRIENVFQVDAHTIIFQILTSSSKSNHIWLYISWHPRAARISLGQPPPKIEALPYSFASTLRSFIKGSTLVGITIPIPFERVVSLEFSERLSDPAKWILNLEVIGGRSNAILTSTSNNIILACGYQVSSTKSIRPLQTGIQYKFPPSLGGLFSPFETQNFDDFLNKLYITHTNLSNKKEDEKSTSRTSLTLSNHLISAFQGVSPMIANDILDAANIPKNSLYSEYINRLQVLPDSDSQNKIIEEQMKNVFLCFQEWSETIRAYEFEQEQTDGSLFPPIRRPPSLAPRILANRYSLFQFLKSSSPSLSSQTTSSSSSSPSHPSLSSSPTAPSDHLLQTVTEDEDSSVRYLDTVSELVEEYYGKRQLLEEFFSLRGQNLQRLYAVKDRAERMLIDFQTRLMEASNENIEKLREKADLLTAYTHTWSPATPSLLCHDFNTGEPVTIALPEGKSPVDAARDLYVRAKKLQRSEDVLGRLLERVNGKLEQIDEIDSALSLLDHYNSHDDLSALREIAEEISSLEKSTIVGNLDQGDTAAGVDDVNKRGRDSAADLNSKSSKKDKGKSNKQKEKASFKQSSKSSTTPSAPMVSSKKSLQGLLVLRPTVQDLGSIVVKEKEIQTENGGRYGDKEYGESNRVTLVVGRNSVQNERISFRVARETDIWFHVQGFPGSHCLLRLEEDKSIEQEEMIQFAADVAAYFSKGRNNNQVPVMFCSPRYLRKGRSPGAVIVDVPKTATNMKSTTKKPGAPNVSVNGVVYGRPDVGRVYTEKFSNSIV